MLLQCWGCPLLGGAVRDLEARQAGDVELPADSQAKGQETLHPGKKLQGQQSPKNPECHMWHFGPFGLAGGEVQEWQSRIQPLAFDDEKPMSHHVGGSSGGGFKPLGWPRAHKSHVNVSPGAIEHHFVVKIPGPARTIEETAMCRPERSH